MALPWNTLIIYNALALLLFYAIAVSKIVVWIYYSKKSGKNYWLVLGVLGKNIGVVLGLKFAANFGLISLEIWHIVIDLSFFLYEDA